MKPLCIELFAGRFGWGRGFVAEGYRVIGFDILHESYHKPIPAGCELVLQDVLTLHGRQFREAAVIVASPPCQAYSYRAMPWKRAKALPPPSNELFDACFRIQREASEAATMAYGCARCGIYHPATKLDGCTFTPRYIPLVVENVKGAQPWVGEAKAHYGSYYLWGDVDTVNGNLVAGLGRLAERVPFHPPNGRAQKFNPDGTEHPQGSWFKIADSKERGAKSPAGNCAETLWKDRDVSRYAHPTACEMELQGIKNEGGSWFAVAHNTESGHGQNPVNGIKVPVYSDPRRNGGRGVHLTNPRENFDGIKQHGSGPEWFDKALDERRKEATAIKNGNDWFGSGEDCSLQRKQSSRSNSRKAASAMIAEIPFDLASWIARCFYPQAQPITIPAEQHAPAVSGARPRSCDACT